MVLVIEDVRNYGPMSIGYIQLKAHLFYVHDSLKHTFSVLHNLQPIKLVNLVFLLIFADMAWQLTFIFSLLLKNWFLTLKHVNTVFLDQNFLVLEINILKPLF